MRSFLAVVSSLQLGGVALAQGPTLATTLQPGPHPVGHRQLLLRDVSRPELPLPGATLGERPGRQTRVLVWYPAASRGSAITYGDYIDAVEQTHDYRPLTPERRRAAASAFVVRAGGLGGDTVALRSALTALSGIPMRARLGATAARGRFPVVLYPEWRPPASNAILAEYLASHGFVVASVALNGTYDGDVEYFSVRGIESMTTDLAFALGALDTMAFADVRNVAAMGVGIAATAALSFQIRSPSVRAFVSLEGGVTTESEQRLIRRTPLFDVARVRVPMLAITAPHPSVDPERLSLYRYAPRRLAHFATMGEFWFLDYGVLERVVPRLIGAPPAGANTVDGHDWGARLVERFLSAHLKGDTVALRWLDAPPAPAGLFTNVLRPASPAPPSVAALKRMIDSGGVRSVAAFAERRAAVDSQPIPAEYFVNLNAWLGEGRDGDGTARHRLAELRARMFPRSARAQFALAGAALRMRDSAQARQRVAESLRLFAEDDDPLLDAPTRAAIERTARGIGVRAQP